MRRGMTIIEVLVAAMIMAAVAVPLLGLFQGGVRTTKATIQEVVGANLAAEMAEQVVTVPFAKVAKLVPYAGDEHTFMSTDGSLADGLQFTEEYGFHLATLPRGFARALNCRRLSDDIIILSSLVEWSVADRRIRKIVVKKCLVRDSLLPN